MPFPLKQVLVALMILFPGAALAQDFTLVFVGGARGDEKSPTLDHLKVRLESLDPGNGLVVFTGNYAAGELPAEGEQGRAQAERAILAHVDATRDFVKRGGRVYFLPGHLDFASGGSKAVNRLRAFLNDAYATPKLDVMPQAACGDPTVLELTDTLGLALVNSEWWMEDWDADPQSNQGCEAKTREAFGLALRDAFNEYRTRRLIIASHHPLLSYGELGDSFSAGAHFTPAPIVGTVGILAAEAGLVPQHHNHPLVRSYVNLLLTEAQRYGSFFFASGHDASLQVLQVGGQTQLISGSSGVSAQPTVATDEGDFAAALPGWAELVITPNGGSEAKLVSGADEKVLFEKKLPELPHFGTASAEPPKPFPPSPVLATYGKSGGEKMSWFGKFFLGSFYNDAYSLQLPYQTLDLQTAEGGLKPLKTGGSFQTNSLHLRDEQGSDWSMRATTKDSSRFLGNKDNEASGGNNTVSHAFTAMHPEAALAVPRLAEAVGVLHATPQLLYLPDQEGLGKYRGYISDEVVLLERNSKESKDGVLPEAMAGAPSPSGATRFRTTEETIEKLMENPAKHRVDQEAMLRARLLDIFLGDWDRHGGQWRFAAIPNADGTRTYRPIPRDRDQAFANYNGFALVLARTSVPQARELQPFDDDIHNLPWLIFSARNLDPVVLNQIPRDRWLAIAAEVKEALSDTVIDEAFSTWHPEAYVLDGARIAGHLKARRDKLVETADQYFGLINKNADVLGSNHDDRFDLWFEDNGAVRVSIRGKEKDSAPWFDRLYQRGQTSELRIYALEGDDALSVHGVPHSAIEIRFVGGEGKDVVAAADPATPIAARAIRLYDSESGALIDPSIEVRDERSNLAHLNQYDRTENHDPSAGIFIPGLATNPDDGVLIGGEYTHTFQGYKKSPYAARHDVLVRFATATLGVAVDYHGLFPQSAQLLDQQVDLFWKTPTWTRNFFGYTNRYVDEGQPLDFYRVRQAAYEARYGASYGFGGDRSRVGAQLTGLAVVTEATTGRFVTQSPEVPPDSLGPRGFIGARLFAETKTFDNPTLPTRGIGLQASIETRFDPVKGGELSTNYKVGATAAIPFDRHRRFVLLTRASLEGIVGAHPFYFSPTLGDTELRAYHRQQLAGDVAFAHTTDLRIAVLRSAAATPGTLGLNLSIDHGRVFGPTISGDPYHLSLGGSIWWSMLDTVAVSVGYYRALDGGSRFILSLGPLFAPTL